MEGEVCSREAEGSGSGMGRGSEVDAARAGGGDSAEGRGSASGARRMYRCTTLGRGRVWDRRGSRNVALDVFAGEVSGRGHRGWRQVGDERWMRDRLRKEEEGGTMGLDQVMAVARRVEDLALGAARGDVGGADWDTCRQKLEDLRAFVQTNEEEVAACTAKLCVLVDLPVNLMRLLYVDAPELTRPGTPAPGGMAGDRRGQGGRVGPEVEGEGGGEDEDGDAGGEREVRRTGRGSEAGSLERSSTMPARLTAADDADAGGGDDHHAEGGPPGSPLRRMASQAQGWVRVHLQRLRSVAAETVAGLGMGRSGGAARPRMSRRQLESETVVGRLEHELEALHSECMLMLRELRFTYQSMDAVFAGAAAGLVPRMFVLMARRKTFDSALGLAEEVLAARDPVYPLDSVPGFGELVSGLGRRELAFFCRLLACLVFDPEDRLQDANIAQATTPLEILIREARTAEREAVAERNHKMLVRIPGLSTRLIGIMRTRSVADLRDDRGGSAAGGSEGRESPALEDLSGTLGRLMEQMELAGLRIDGRTDGPREPVDAARATQELTRERSLARAPMEEDDIDAIDLQGDLREFEDSDDDDGDDENDEAASFTLDLPSFTGVSNQEGDEPASGGATVGAAEGEGEITEEEAPAAHDPGQLPQIPWARDIAQGLGNGHGFSVEWLLSQMGSTQGLKMMLATHQVEVLFVMCALLGSAEKIAVQDRFAELGLAGALAEMMEDISWVAAPFTPHSDQVTGIHSPGCECNPENSRKIQFLRLIISFCDRDCNNWPNKCRLLSTDEVEEVEALEREFCQWAETDPIPREFANRKARFKALASRGTTQGEPSGGSSAEMSTPQNDDDQSEGEDNMEPLPDLEVERLAASGETPCPGTGKVMSHLVKALAQQPVDGTFRFWLASATESFLRGLRPGAQLFVARLGLLHHLVDDILDKGFKPASSLQMDFDLLGELLKYNPAVLAMIEDHFDKTPGGFERFAEAMMNSLIDSNVFLRASMLTVHRFPDHPSVKGSRLANFFLVNRVKVLHMLMGLVEVSEVNQENICVLNSALIICVCAKREGILSDLIDEVRAHDEDCIPWGAESLSGYPVTGIFADLACLHGGSPSAVGDSLLGMGSPAEATSPGGLFAACTPSPNDTPRPSLAAPSSCANFHRLVSFWDTYYRTRKSDWGSLEFSNGVRMDEWHAVVGELLTPGLLIPAVSPRG